MAIKILTVADARGLDTLVDVTPEAATTAADGFEATIDGRTMVVVQNTSADTAYNITFSKGDGMQSVADVTASVAFGAVKVFFMNTGRFKFFKGTNKGKVLIVPANAAVKVKVIKY